VAIADTRPMIKGNEDWDPSFFLHCFMLWVSGGCRGWAGRMDT